MIRVGSLVMADMDGAWAVIRDDRAKGIGELTAGAVGIVLSYTVPANSPYFQPDADNPEWVSILCGSLVGWVNVHAIRACGGDTALS